MSSENGYRERCLREKGRECDLCGATDDLEVHHIDGDRSNNSLENLVPLCKEHHRAVHRGDDDVGDFVEQLNEIDPDKMVRATVSLDQNIHQYVKERAESSGVSFSKAVRIELRAEMNRDRTDDERGRLEIENKHLQSEVEYLRRALLAAVE